MLLNHKLVEVRYDWRFGYMLDNLVSALQIEKLGKLVEPGVRIQGACGGCD